MPSYIVDISHPRPYQSISSPIASRMASLHAPLGFLDRDERYAKEKPYALRYSPADDIPMDNIVKKVVNDVELYDIRNLPAPLSFDENGLTVRSIQSEMAYEDWFDGEMIKNIFFPELRKNLEGLFGTSNIQIFEYKVRERGLCPNEDRLIRPCRSADAAKQFP